MLCQEPAAGFPLKPNKPSTSPDAGLTTSIIMRVAVDGWSIGHDNMKISESMSEAIIGQKDGLSPASWQYAYGVDQTQKKSLVQAYPFRCSCVADVPQFPPKRVTLPLTALLWRR